MPKLELKAVQRELEQGLIWPFYWIYGPEKLKSRELLKRIRTAVSGREAHSLSLNEEVFDGSDTDASTVLDSARSLCLGGGIRLVIVREAHALKSPEVLAELFGPAQKQSELTAVCVCISKDLDGRKKFSKVLQEKVAVVPCEEVNESQRDSWIQYLAKQRGLNLNTSLVLKLSALDPWSLDIVDQELQKYAVAGQSEDVILESSALSGGTEAFLESFFARDLLAALPQVSYFADHPDESLPLLGLMGWNVRQLAVLIADRAQGTRYSKLNPYVAERLQKWSGHWRFVEIVELQDELSQIDFNMKQTPLLPLGLWSSLVTRFCKH
jgi:DNA polymerase III delta subunit